jgi:hypothetical protein
MKMIALALFAAACAGSQAHQTPQYNSEDVTDYEITVQDKLNELPEDSDAAEDIHDKLTTLEAHHEGGDADRIHDDLENVRDAISNHEVDCDSCRDTPDPEDTDGDDDGDDDPDSN